MPNPEQLQFNKFFDSSNKLFCTFTSPEELENTIIAINRKYTVLHDKIFILSSPQSDELICTYNLDTAISAMNNMPNTILLHRKKESNTLYTINSLNALIRSLNNGKEDRNFKVNWSDYQNSILLTSGAEVRQLNTLLHKIITN